MRRRCRRCRPMCRYGSCRRPGPAIGQRAPTPAADQRGSEEHCRALKRHGRLLCALQGRKTDRTFTPRSVAMVSGVPALAGASVSCRHSPGPRFPRTWRCTARPRPAPHDASMRHLRRARRGLISRRYFGRGFYPRAGRGPSCGWLARLPALLPGIKRLDPPFRYGAGRPRAKGLNGAMKHKNSHLLVGYWSRLRKGREVPDQTDIDPRALSRLLSYTFILDCENPGAPDLPPRRRLCALCRRFGFELKGTGFPGPVGVAIRRWRLASLLRQALEPAASRFVYIQSVAADRRQWHGRAGDRPDSRSSFNGGEPEALLRPGADAERSPRCWAAVACAERLIASQLIQEDEPLAATIMSRRRPRRPA